MRDEEAARGINSTRSHPRFPEYSSLHPRILAISEIERAFEQGVQAVIWALPSKVTREVARRIAKHFRGDEILIHATKGVEEDTLKRMSVVLTEELPLIRVGVLSGPNLAGEIAAGKPAATVIASAYAEVCEAGRMMLTNPNFRVYSDRDVIGVEWAGTLKNVLAIASGIADTLDLGWNTRSLLITRGLAEMVRFGVAMGAQAGTFLGLAGVGDLLATCGSSQSRNYRVGQGLAQGKTLTEILQTLGSTAEGVRTAQSVFHFSREMGIEMPITEAVCALLEGERNVREVLKELMTRPQVSDRTWLSKV
jgi:glycerol-3-phosphate dehydrogenase (NAD(P)+)